MVIKAHYMGFLDVQFLIARLKHLQKVMLLINTLYFINKDWTAVWVNVIIASIFNTGIKKTIAEPTPPNTVKIATNEIAYVETLLSLNPSILQVSGAG